MFRKNLVPVWAAIIVLSSMFLLGQEMWVPPCMDDDGDGYGSLASVACTFPEKDCDDGRATIYPGAPELCDGVDNQCTGDPGYGFVDEGYAACGEMAEIPAGCFDMGDHFGEGSEEELPVHNVCISGFDMDLYEVTNAEYKTCRDAGECSAPYHTYSSTRPTYYGDPAYDGFPVIWVNWGQARSYCEWAGKRLPSEAEWEYAARGGLVGKRYPWGDTISGSDANYLDSGDPWDNDTTPKGFYPANGYGLYDVGGNVWEWVNDWYHEDYYEVSPSNDPQGFPDGTEKVLRGGSFSGELGMRVAFRLHFSPIIENTIIGFRCAR